MEDNQKKYTELANRIYDLDGAVYECVGSSLADLYRRKRENSPDFKHADVYKAGRTSSEK